MRIREDDELRKALVEDLKKRFAPRGGIHLTDLIFCLRKSFFAKTQPEELTEEQILLYTTGLGWQDKLPLPNPGQVFEEDGIKFSPDGWVEKEDGRVFIEVKSTRARTRDPQEMKHWVDQLKGYCALGRAREGVLVALHLMGDYRNRKAELKVHRFEFDEEELEEMREYLRKRREALERALESGEAPPPEPSYKWECNYCPYRELCEEVLINGAKKEEGEKEHEGQDL